MGSKSADIDAYIDGLDEPKRTTLRHLRTTLRRLLPDAEETIAYGLPAFRVNGKVVAGFGAFKRHLSYLPHSGSVFPELEARLAGYTYSTGSLRFPIDEPLPDDLVQELVSVRRRQAGV